MDIATFGNVDEGRSAKILDDSSGCYSVLFMIQGQPVALRAMHDHSIHYLYDAAMNWVREADVTWEFTMEERLKA